MIACDLVSVELRLDRIEAELASELPAHVDAFARCYARNEAPPPAPAVLHRPATLSTARAALGHPLLAERGLALLRLVAPIAIEDDPAVAAARMRPPSWDALAALTRARDAAAQRRFGRRAIDVLHRLHGATGATAATGGGELPAAIAGWNDPDGVGLELDHAWATLGERHGVRGTLGVTRASGLRPRAFLVEPARYVIVALATQCDTPAGRFAVLHELGHALAGLAAPAGVPRVLDEAIAAYIARDLEDPGSPWHSPLATAARHRRRALARALDHLERDLPAFSASGAIRPPWALWHDAGAQAAYVGAEDLADALAAALGPAPPPGALIAALAQHRAAIDRVDTGL